MQGTKNHGNDVDQTPTGRRSLPNFGHESGDIINTSQPQHCAGVPCITRGQHGPGCS